MLAYSAKKKIANAIPEYSTWNPATISDSPSATSNGARLVSATLAIQYTTNNGNNGKKYQCHNPPLCFNTNSDKFIVHDEFIGISVETKWWIMALVFFTIISVICCVLDCECR